MKERKNKSTYKYIFIGGAGHSGTSMLSKVFNNHPDSIGVKGESRVPESLDLIIKSYNKLIDSEVRLAFLEDMVFNGYNFKKNKYNYSITSQNPYVGSLKSGLISGDFVKDYKLIIKQTLLNYNKSIFVEKTPSNVFHFKEIKQLIPEAKLIIIHRDIRDVIASLKKRFLTLKKQPEVFKHNLETKKLDKDYNLVIDAFMWNKIVKESLSLKIKYPDDIYIIKYEDLVKDPKGFIFNICNWLDIDFNVLMLDLKSRNSSDLNLLKTKGITESSVNKYDEILSANEISLIQKYSKNQLVTLNYKLVITNVKKLEVVKLEFISYLKILDRIYRRLKLFDKNYALDFSKRVAKKVFK
jgi:hypothetical protein